MKWINVNDQTPGIGEEVLITHVNETGAVSPEIAYMEICADTGAEYWANGEEVTHWCAIPDLPKHTPIVADKFTKAAIEKLKNIRI